MTDLEVLLKNKAKLGRLERFHDALQKKDEAFSLFNLGYLDLENRAAAEQIFWQICEQIAKEGQKAGYQPEELHDLSKLLADQYVCNFSVFQSLLDHWALGALFPIVPLHRLAATCSVPDRAWFIPAYTRRWRSRSSVISIPTSSR